MKIYLASPFFNDEQNAVVESIEATLRQAGHEVFSPREGTKLGDQLGKTMEERLASAKEIYDRNVDAMNWAEVMVAVVDGSDAGTMFEVGFYAANKRPIVSFTSKNKPLNIMIQQAVIAHCLGINDLKVLFDAKQPMDIAHEFRNFHPDMI